MALICQNRPVPWRGLTEKLGKLEARVIQRCIQVDTYVRGVCSRVCDARRPRGLKSFGFGLVAAHIVWEESLRKTKCAYVETPKIQKFR